MVVRLPTSKSLACHRRLLCACCQCCACGVPRLMLEVMTDRGLQRIGSCPQGGWPADNVSGPVERPHKVPKPLEVGALHQRCPNRPPRQQPDCQ